MMMMNKKNVGDDFDGEHNRWWELKQNNDKNSFPTTNNQPRQLFHSAGHLFFPFLRRWTDDDGRKRRKIYKSVVCRTATERAKKKKEKQKILVPCWGSCASPIRALFISSHHADRFHRFSVHYHMPDHCTSHFHSMFIKCIIAWKNRWHQQSSDDPTNRKRMEK